MGETVSSCCSLISAAAECYEPRNACVSTKKSSRLDGQLHPLNAQIHWRWYALLANGSVNGSESALRFTNPVFVKIGYAI